MIKYCVICNRERKERLLPFKNRSICLNCEKEIIKITSFFNGRKIKQKYIARINNLLDKGFSLKESVLNCAGARYNKARRHGIISIKPITIITKKERNFEGSINRRNEKYKRELRRKATSSEKIAMQIFKENKVKIDFQKGFYSLKGKYKGYHCIVDFYNKRKKIVIEIDGGYHTTEEQKRKDIFRDWWLLKFRKVTVKRISNENVKSVMKLI